MEIEHIIQTLQVSATPCVLIAGFGFLLLSMTNRLSKAADRIRVLNKEILACKTTERSFLRKQIDYLFQRCQYLQIAIASIIFSIFGISVCVMLIFIGFTLGWNTALFIEVVFASSIFCLLNSLLFFMLDVRGTLTSLRIEISQNPQ